MNAIDTTQNNPAPEFAATDRMIVIGKSGHSHRWTYVYNPSKAALAWDGADARTTHCVGSRFGGYSYVSIKVTGRADRYDIAGTGTAVRKIRITFAQGTADEETVDGWLIGGGDTV